MVSEITNPGCKYCKYLHYEESNVYWCESPDNQIVKNEWYEDVKEWGKPNKANKDRDCLYFEEIQ